MKQLTVRTVRALLLGLSATVLAAHSALAGEAARPAARTPPLPPATFKLRVNLDNFPGDLVVSDGYKLPPKVDSALVQQIHQARLSVPAWHGVHTMTPGISATGL